MIKLPWICSVLVLALASTSSLAATPCLDCGTMPQFTPMSREMIKAERDKFDTAMKADTRRPWDKPASPAAVPAAPRAGEVAK